MGMSKKWLSGLLLWVCMLQPMRSSSSQSPTWEHTDQIQSGILAIVVDGDHQQNTSTYVHPYSPQFGSVPKTALGVVLMQTKDLHEQVLKFKVVNQGNMTHMKVQMVNPLDTQWEMFKISFLAVNRSTSFDMFNVYPLDFSTTLNVSSDIGTRTWSGNLPISPGPNMNLTHQYSFSPMLTGIYCHSVQGRHTVFWDVGIKDANQFSYNLTVQRTTRVFYLTSNLLVVDVTLTAPETLTTYMDVIFSTGTNNSPNLQQLIEYNASNLHAGLNSFSFQLIQFTFDQNNLGLASIGYYYHINVSIWSYRKRSCNSNYPYYEEVANLCYDVCPQGFVDSTANDYCRTCDEFISGCRLCSADGSVCQSCLHNYVQIVANSTCQCPDGFYVSDQYQNLEEKCRTCHVFCKTCNGPDKDDCITCGIYRSLSVNNTCDCDHTTYASDECSGPCDNLPCSLCTVSAVCQACQPRGFQLEDDQCVCPQRFYYNSTNVTCIACHYSCVHCSGPNANQCQTCDRINDRRYFDSNSHTCLCIANYQQIIQTCQTQVRASCTQPGYELNSAGNHCVQICGDGIKIFQECDDNNVIDGDGCSSKCEIETDYICADNSLAPTRRSYCSYTKEIKFTLLYITKDIYDNRLHLTYSMDPLLFNVFNVHSELTDNVTYQPASYKISTKSAHYDLSSQQVYVSVEYEEDVHDKEIQLVFKPPVNAEAFAIKLSKQKSTILPENNLIAKNHDDRVYNDINAAKIIIILCFILGLSLTFVLIFYRKMMGLQLICMFQLLYFASMLADYSPALMGPMQQLHFVNGYNGFQLGLPNTLIENSFRTLNYKYYFFANCNTMIVVSLIVYVAALVLFLLSMLADKRTSRKFLDFTFGVMVFFLNNAVVSIVMEIYSGQLGQFDYGWNKTFMGAAVIIIIGQAGYSAYKIHDMQESKNYYHRNKNYTHYFPLIFIAKNFLIIVMIALTPTLKNISSIIVLCLQLFYIVGVFVARPYRRKPDYVRFGIIEFTLFYYILLRFFEANFVKSQQDNEFQGFLFYSGYLMLVLMLMSVLITIILFGYHLFKAKVKDIVVNPEDEFEDSEFQNKLKSRKVKKGKDLEDAEKSKQLIIYNLEDEEGDQRAQDQVTNVFAGESTMYDRGSRRKLRSRQPNDDDDIRFD